jgi:ribosome recycling factor
MQKAVDVVASNFNTMRTGRANPAILDRIQVGVGGGWVNATCSPAKQLGHIQAPGPRVPGSGW